MKKPRQSWATRPMPPITAKRIEDYIDFLAEVMHRTRPRRDAELFLPIWRRLHRELAIHREKEQLLADAEERYRRNQERTRGGGSP